MIEFIVLFFLCKQIGALALQKGLNPTRWKWYTVLAWIGAEFLGFILGILLFGFEQNDIIGLILFSVVCAFGGYLWIRYLLENKPDQSTEQ